MTKVFVAHAYRDLTYKRDDYRSAFSDLKSQLKGVSFVFADDDITSQHISAKIITKIESSDILLFDITSWNPNVTLELGVALGLKKKLFLLFDPTYGGENVPSDISGMERIQYQSMTDMKTKISFAISKYLESLSPNISAEVDSVREKVLEFVLSNGPVSISKVSDELSINQNFVRPILYELRENGLISVEGAKRGTKYTKP